MAFKKIDTYLSSTLDLPIGDKVYKIQPVDAKTGLWVERIMALSNEARQAQRNGTKIHIAPDQAAELQPPGDNSGRRTLFETILGDTHAELLEDGVDHELVKLIGATALIWITAGMDEAETYWNENSRPGKAPKKPADRKPKKKASAASSTTSA